MDKLDMVILDESQNALATCNELLTSEITEKNKSIKNLNGQIEKQERNKKDFVKTNSDLLKYFTWKGTGEAEK